MRYQTEEATGKKVTHSPALPLECGFIQLFLIHKNGNMKLDKNVVGWFEIPVTDMDRAVAFYEAVFGFKLQRHIMGPLEMAWFPFNEDPNVPGANGTLIKHPDFYKPSVDGTLIYFTAWSGNVEHELKLAEINGGKILIPKKMISPEHGYMGMFQDSEGNRIAVHTAK